MPQLFELLGMSADQIIRWSVLWLPLLYAAARVYGYVMLDIEQNGK